MKPKASFNRTRYGKRHTLPNEALNALRALVNTQLLQLVADINAVYAVSAASTTKIEAVGAVPDSPEPSEYDEVFPIAVSSLTDSPRFSNQGEAGFAYEVVATTVLVKAIDLVQALVKFPEDEVVEATDESTGRDGLNSVQCGILIDTDKGAVCLFQRHPGFGFHWPTGKALVASRAAAIAALPRGYFPVKLPSAT